RIGIMQDGRLVQVGTPREIYDRPQSRFVADFIGTSSFLEGRVMARDQAGLTISLPGDVQIRVALPPDASEPGDVATVAIRPEKFRILRDGEQADNRVEGQISGQTFLGESLLSQVRLRTG